MSTTRRRATKVHPSEINEGDLIRVGSGRIYVEGLVVYIYEEHYWYRIVVALQPSGRPSIQDFSPGQKVGRLLKAKG